MHLQMSQLRVAREQSQPAVLSRAKEAPEAMGQKVLEPQCLVQWESILRELSSPGHLRWAAWDLPSRLTQPLAFRVSQAVQAYLALLASQVLPASRE